MIFHIRKRLKPLGGNAFYKDKTVREGQTFCGLTCTSYDVSWNSKATTWRHTEHGMMYPCQTCLDFRKKEQD